MNIQTSALFDLPHNALAHHLANELESGYRAISAGNVVIIPKVPGGSVDEIVEMTGLDENLIFDHPDYPDRCWLIECPEDV